MTRVVETEELAPKESADTPAKEDRAVVETLNLTKRYGNGVTAVQGLNLRVLRGEIYGFLGPNGAGKTTTLRMLVGLIRPTHGNVSVLGLPAGCEEGLARVGTMIEAPAFYPYLSARDNLRVVARYAGVPETRLDRALATVDLSARAEHRFGTYSQGMKQRLGVAAALLKDPELLILDEPTSGLDPAGMAEMRALIRNLAGERRTVLLSSHLMSEVEQICDRVGIIRNGSLVAEGTIDELRGGQTLRVRAKPLEKAERVIGIMPGVSSVAVAEGHLRITADPAMAPAINRALVGADIEVSELVQERDSLEQVFLELTQAGKDETR